jgi:hypothetical protein
MAIVSRAEFARMTGKTRAAVTNGVKRGYIIATADGNIDTDDPTNVLYLDRAAIENAPTSDRGTQPRKKRPKEAPPLPEPEDVSADTAADLDEIDLDHPERYINSYGDNLEARNKAAQVLQRIAQVRAAEQKRRKEAGELIEQDLVKRWFGDLSAAMHTNLLSLPRRVVAQVVATARSQDEHAVEELLKDEIQSALQKTKNELNPTG